MDSNKIHIYVPSDQLTDLAIELSQVDGIEMEIEQGKVEPPDHSKEHGLYHIDPTTIVTVIVSVTALLTSSFGLAKALLDYLATRNKTKSKDLEVAKETALIINNTYIVRLSGNPRLEEVADYLQKNEVKTIFFE